MKSILIDPSNKTVTDIERDDDFKNIAPLIAAESGLFCPVRIGRNVVLYVDDEGLLTQPNPHGYFRLADYPQVLAGKGLVVGVSVSGYDEDAPFDAATLAPHVEFIDNPDPAEIEAKIEVVGWDRDTGVETRQTITPPTTTRGKH